jgi:hypothetical protein
LGILVAELELGALGIDGFHFVGRAKAHVGTFPGADVADDGLDESAQVPRGAVLDFEDDGRIAVVADAHAATEIVGVGHKDEFEAD